MAGNTSVCGVSSQKAGTDKILQNSVIAFALRTIRTEYGVCAIDPLRPLNSTLITVSVFLVTDLQ